jgi:outer membrane receptor for ferrienterochelin and colicin
MYHSGHLLKHQKKQQDSQIKLIGKTMNSRKSFSMKSSFMRIFRTTVFYLALGLVLQVITVTNLLASQSPEDKSLKDVKLKITGTNVSFEQALQQIEQQTDFKFFYIKEDVPLNEKVKLNQEEESLYQILQGFAREYGLEFSKINNQIVIKKAENTTYKVSGVVRDISANEPLVFANIIIEGTQQGTTTDANGKFTLTLPQGTYSLRCSFVGYRTEIFSITVPEAVQLTINMSTMDMLLQDVTVYAHRLDETDESEVSALSLQSDRMKQVTSAISDVLRSVQFLPGVTTNNEFSAKFNVRGGNQDENLVLVNGTQVYDPFHLKEAPNASVGIFNTDMIQKMDLLTGGFPARYGDRMSSVLNIEYREGNREKYTGIASLSMANIDALVEGPLGEHGSFMFGGRKSYLEYIMKMLDYDPSIHPSFYDLQGVIGYSLSPSNKILLKFIHAGDKYIEDPHTTFEGPYQWKDGDSFTATQQWNDSVNNKAHYYSNMIALQNVNILSSSALLKTELSYYDQRETERFWYSNHYKLSIVAFDTAKFYRGENEELYDNTLKIRTLELNSILDMQISSPYGLKTGISYQRIKYDQDQINKNIIDIYTNVYQYPDTTHQHGIENALDSVDNHIGVQSYKVAGFLENIIQLSDRMILNVGGRFDYFDLNKDLTWSPRINMAYQTDLGITVRGAWGYYYQSPIYRQIAYPIASDTNTHPQRAIHYVLGVDYDVNIGDQAQHFIKIKLEGYHKKYDDLITSTQSSRGIISYSRKNDATGKTWGTDLYIAYSQPGFYGWLSYGLLSSKQELRDGTSFPRNTDQRHTLAAVGDVELGSGWSMNARFVYGSGYAYTPSTAIYKNVTKEYEWIEGKPNSEYLPSYQRVDLRISKDLVMFGKSTSIYLDVSNLLNAKNIQAYRYRFNDIGKPLREDVKLWPILPTLGVSVRF